MKKVRITNPPGQGPRDPIGPSRELSVRAPGASMICVRGPGAPYRNYSLGPRGPGPHIKIIRWGPGAPYGPLKLFKLFKLVTEDS